VNLVREIKKQLKPVIDGLPLGERIQIRKSIREPLNIQNAGLWIAAIVAGFTSVGYALLFREADRLFHSFLSSAHSRWSFALTPMLFLLAWYLVKRFAPEAAGSGIPQIMAANEMDYRGPARTKIDRLLSLQTAAIKVVSSLLCVLGGGAIGREGPTLQISTSLFHFFGTKVRKYVPESSEQTWVVAGAAAGLASAFNTPLGGIVYAIEELGVSHFHRVRTALIGAVIVSGLVAQLFLGSYLYLGFPQLEPIGFTFLPMAIMVGLATGLAGGLFGKILFFLLEWRQRIQSLKTLALVTLACGLIMASFFVLTHHAAGTGIETITGFLFRGEFADGLLIFVRFFGTMVSYLSGAAGGIFSPSLAIGASIGSWITETFETHHPNLMVLLGMIGFLTGVTRTPFTAFILVLEMTDRHVAIFPMMIVALTAQWAARLMDNHSFYEHVKEKWLFKPPAEAPAPAVS